MVALTSANAPPGNVVIHDVPKRFGRFLNRGQFDGFWSQMLQVGNRLVGTEGQQPRRLLRELQGLERRQITQKRIRVNLELVAKGFPSIRLDTQLKGDH